MTFRIAAIALAAALPAAAAAPEEPRIDVKAASAAEGDRVRVQVAALAPLPDGTGLVFRLSRAADRGPADVPVASRSAEMKDGACRQELALESAKALPGEYVVSVQVSPDQATEVRRRLRPSQRRLEGEARVLVGGRAQVAAAVNQAARLLLGASGKVQEAYPALATMLARAWKKDLTEAEWKACAWREPLLRSCRTLDGARAHPLMGLFPRTTGKAQALTVEIHGMIGTIDNFVGGRKPTDEPVRPRESSDPRIRTSVDGLHAELFGEGFAVYAGVAAQLLDDVEAAYAARRGKGANGWASLETGWSDTIARVDASWEEFNRIEWPIDRADLSLRLREALAGVKEHAHLCGRILKAELTEEAGEYDGKRAALRQRVAGLK